MDTQNPEPGTAKSVDGGAVHGASTERTRRLRARVMKAPMEVSLIRARKYTEARRLYADKPLIIQRALALKDTLEATPAVIFPDELIVGRATEKFTAAAVYPEVRSEWLFKELKAMDRRPTHKFVISAEEAAGLEQIAAQWVGNTAQERMLENLSPAARELREKIVVTGDGAFNYGLHLFYPDLKTALAHGLNGLLDGARRRKAGATEQEQVDFYTAVEIVLAAAQNWILAYAAEAERQAAQADGERSRELYDIARVLSNIARRPAATFHEGLQLVYLLHLLLDLADGGHEIPYGRLDQLLFPLFAADMESGVIDLARARELVEAFYIQASTIVHFLEGLVALGDDGNTGRLDLTVGGMDEAGQDATNALSYLFLSTMGQLRTLQPNVMVRLHRDTPEEFLDLVTRVLTDGSNTIAVFNDEVIIPALTAAGVALADAREYLVGGCVSPVPRGTYGPLCGAHVFAPKVLERVRTSGTSYSSYDAFYQDFKAELSRAVAMLAEIVHAGDAAHRDLLPQPLVSALVEGCLERGTDVKTGGGRYNLTGMNFIGFANIVDSLAAIKHLVFTTGQMTLAEMAQAVAANFEGHEQRRQLMLHQAPRFGNDDDGVDSMARELFDFYHAEVTQHPTLRGGHMVPGIIAATTHILGGFVSGATPDGRPARTPLAVGAAPSNGAARQGPTAALKSVTAIDHTKGAAGVSVNLRFHPSALQTENDIQKFRDLLRTYFWTLGGMHLQFSVVDAATLRAAKAEPEKYQDLMVRVAGYCARFVDLSPMTQDEIIARSEYGGI